MPERPRRSRGDPEPRWASRAEAAEYGRWSEPKLDYLIAAGDLPAYRVPTRTGGARGSVRIDLNDIDALLAARKVSSARDAGAGP